MNSRTSVTALRREALRRRCAMQREQLAEAVNAVGARLQSINHATLASGTLGLKQVLLIVVTAAFAAIPLLRNIGRGLSIAMTLVQLLRSRRGSASG